MSRGRFAAFPGWRRVRTSPGCLVRDGRYLLLTGPGGQRWAEVAREIDPLGTVLDTASLPRPEAFGVSDDGALLIRPDQVIAWRATGSDQNPTSILSNALQRALGRLTTTGARAQYPCDRSDRGHRVEPHPPATV
ncbi:hypothetical protein [Nocardia sp. NPDC020380]|uniref:aromatic-ring hydroxylase C-terminal domain-containing protein n=1 Tax=Nocardia sp. NPDC020380 TaxID=3364309 RepID=UPI0037B4A696